MQCPERIQRLKDYQVEVPCRTSALDRAALLDTPMEYYGEH